MGSQCSVSTASCFVSAASFVGCEGNSEIRRVPFMQDLSTELNEILKKQYDDFAKFSQIDFDGRYKVDRDECFSIQGYKDPDKTINGFQSIIEGKNSTALKFVDDLSECKALLFRIRQLPDILLIQRFSNSYLARRDKWYGLANGDAVQRIDHSAFTIGSSLAGFFDLKNNKLCFKSVQSIRSALPGFADEYVPGADGAMIEKFFSNECFLPTSVQIIKELDSVKVARLVWLLVEQNEDVNKRMDKFEYFNEVLNLDSIKNGKINLRKEVSRVEVILRILMGDVFEDNKKIYLSNYKKPISRFD